MTMIEKLQKFFDEKVINQGELEIAAALAGGRISKWKQGKGEIGACEALRMARALKVPVEWLIDAASDWPPPTMVSPDRQQQVAEIARRYGWDFVYWRLMDVVAGQSVVGTQPDDLETVLARLAAGQPIGSNVPASNAATDAATKAASDKAPPPQKRKRS